MVSSSIPFIAAPCRFCSFVTHGSRDRAARSFATVAAEQPPLALRCEGQKAAVEFGLHSKLLGPQKPKSVLLTVSNSPRLLILIRALLHEIV